ncbi:MAG TPA: response regulator [Pirellulales bacterium]|nr:response regulator [Pirellulales bacterium]
MATEPMVFVVDDEEQIRRPLALLLREAGFKVESFGSAESFLATYEGEPGCLLLDIRLAGAMNGLDLQQALAERGHGLPIVFMSAYANVPTTVQAIKAGAVDVLEKPFDTEALVGRVRTAIEHGMQNYARRKELAAELEKLSRRQREVMQLLLEARDTKEIARTLGISPKTVEKHRANVLLKMRVDNVVGLMRHLMPNEVAAL